MLLSWVLLSTLPQTLEGGFAFQKGYWRDIKVINKTKSGQNESISTWKHRQPSSVKGDPNRITRQARILPSIFKSNIGQVENLYLLICSVNTCGLGRGGMWKRTGERRTETERSETHNTKIENKEVLDGIHDEVLSTGRIMGVSVGVSWFMTETETVPTKNEETVHQNKSTKGSRHQQSLTEASHDLGWTHAFTDRAWRALHCSTKHQPGTASKSRDNF